MPIHWPEATVRGRELTVYITPGASRSTVWMNVLGHVLKEFNAVSKAHKLPMRLKASNLAPKENSGADIAINVATDKINLTFPGHDPVSETFSAIQLHGRTLLFHRKNELLKAFVYLPPTPKINTPKGMRGVGPKVLTVIALHELLHACALDEDEHGDFGLFQANPSVNFGDTPIQDTVSVRSNVVGAMPPYVIDDATVQTLLDRWTP
jgi:hypothetical protein